MKIAHQHTALFLTIALLILASFSFLAWTESVQRDPRNTSWWSLSFDNPLTDNLSFTIENFSPHQEFNYVITPQNEKEISGTMTIPQGTRKTMTVPAQLRAATITVTTAADTKSLKK